MPDQNHSEADLKMNQSMSIITGHPPEPDHERIYKFQLHWRTIISTNKAKLKIHFIHLTIPQGATKPFLPRSKCIGPVPARLLRLTMMWQQALLYRWYAAHARREPTHLEQVGSLCCREEERGRHSISCCLLVDAVKLGMMGMEEVMCKM
jgi:hypothetical protein